jgi:hypothetical protein
MNFPQTLEAEFKRLAKKEQKPMEELVEEIARLVKKSVRQVYNWRSGKWDVPSQLVPVLCRRFGSLALIHALEDECRDIEAEMPEAFDLARLTSQTIREDLLHYERVMVAFEDRTITEGEFGEKVASGARVISNVRQFEAIAQGALERRHRSQADAK